MKTKIKYLLVLVLASFVFAGCCTMHSKTKQMEYKVVFTDFRDAENQLNKLGNDGWKLFNTIPGSNDSVTYIFERPKH
jgi:ABC-type oligopeptide transport system substrate-binding subunit